MPYLKADNARAIAIHEEYQSTNDSKTFMKATREFLANPTTETTIENSTTKNVMRSDTNASLNSTNPGATTVDAETSTTIPAPALNNTTTNIAMTSNLSHSNAAETTNAVATTPIQSPIRPPPSSFPQQYSQLPVQQQQQQQRPLATTPVSHVSAMSNQSPSSFSLGHGPNAANIAVSPSSPSYLLNHPNPPSFLLPPTLQQQQQQLQPPLMPSPAGLGGTSGSRNSSIDVGRAMNPNFPHQQQPSPQALLPHQGLGTLHQQQHQQHRQQQHHHEQPHQPVIAMDSLEQQLNQLIGGEDDFLNSDPIREQQQEQQKQQANQNLRNKQQDHTTTNSSHDHALSFLSSLAEGEPPTPAPSLVQLPTSSTPKHETVVNTVATPMTPMALLHDAQQQQQQQHQSVESQPQVEGQTGEPPPPPTPQIVKTQKKEAIPPKRLWTKREEQPGSVIVHELKDNNPDIVMDVRPRQELTGKWMLSFKYIQERAEELAQKELENAVDEEEKNKIRFKCENPLNWLLPNLRLGLFRRGCAENGSQASIISKSVMVSNGGRPPFVDPKSQMVIGSVPFYSPRTPGHVVFRLYWDDDPLYTLATGTTMLVRVLENDYESTIRFLLSNLKKKINPTSLSSLHSLAVVLETPLRPPPPQRGYHQHEQQQMYDRAGRATWGCICEARKVVEACAVEYAKTSQKLEKLEQSVEELKQDEARLNEEIMTSTPSVENGDDIDGSGEKQPETILSIENCAVEEEGEDNTNERQQELNELSQNLREKTRSLMSGRASCERKWRDSQLAFAGILKVYMTICIAAADCVPPLSHSHLPLLSLSIIS